MAHYKIKTHTCVECGKEFRGFIAQDYEVLCAACDFAAFADMMSVFCSEDESSDSLY